MRSRSLGVGVQCFGYGAKHAPPHWSRSDRSCCAALFYLLFITKNMAAWCGTRSSTSLSATTRRVNNKCSAGKSSPPYLPRFTRVPCVGPWRSHDVFYLRPIKNVVVCLCCTGIYTGSVEYFCTPKIK